MIENSILFEPANANDYPEILQLNQAAVPAVNSIDAAMLGHLHQQSEALIVARAASRVAAFLLALNEATDYTSINFQYFKRNYEQFAYIDRIVVDPDFRRLGIGAGLYQALASHTETTLTCEVNVRPPNPGSLAFHQGLGFAVVDEQDTEGGSKRVALMVRHPTDTNE